MWAPLASSQILQADCFWFYGPMRAAQWGDALWLFGGFEGYMLDGRQHWGPVIHEEGRPRVITQPQSLVVAPGADVILRAEAWSTLSMELRWQKDGVPLMDGGSVAGAGTDTLLLRSVTSEDAGGYALTAANDCGSAESEPAVLSVASSVLDLAAEAVIVQGNPVPGHTVHVTWTTRNLSLDATIGGGFVDGVYLSADPEWDRGDPLLGKETCGVSLGPGASCEAELDVELPGREGAQYILVVSDARQQLYESDEDNNTAASSALDMVVDRLVLNAPSSGRFEPTEHSRFYAIEVAAHTDFEVSLDDQDDSGVNELYVSYAIPPTRSRHDFGQAEPRADQSLRVPAAAEGVYYILVYGKLLYGADDYSIVASQTPFGIQRVSPSLVGTDGPVTLSIRGAQLGEDVVFHLEDSAGMGIAPMATQVDSRLMAEVTFDFNHAAAGPADVIAVKGELTARLEDAITIERGYPGNFVMSMSGPSAVRGGGYGHWEYKLRNDGGTDVRIPLLACQVAGASYLSTPNGHNHGQTLLVLGLPEGRVGTTLRPEEEVTIPVMAGFPASSSGTADLVSVAMDPLTGQLADLPIPYDEMMNNVPGGPTPEWEWYFQQFRDRYGETLSSYYAGILSEVPNYAFPGVPFGQRFRRFAHIAGEWDVEYALPVDDEPSEPIRGVVAGVGRSKVQAGEAQPVRGGGDGIQRTHVVVIGGSGFQDGFPTVIAEYTSAFFEGKLPDPPTTIANATKQDIVIALRSLQADGDDRVLIEYLGHGNQGTGDWAPDGTAAGVFSPMDLVSELIQVGAAEYAVISDSCFSSGFAEGFAYWASAAGLRGVAMSAGGRDDEVYPGAWGAALLNEFQRDPSGFEYYQAWQNAMLAYAMEHPRLYGVYIPFGGGLSSPGEFDAFRPYWMIDQLLLCQGAGCDAICGGLPLATCIRSVLDLIDSCDPNLMTGPAGYGEEHWVNPHEPMAYTVQFENAAEATAAALRVEIVTDLDSNLDWNTLQLTSFGFGTTWIRPTRKLPHYEDRQLVECWTWTEDQGWHLIDDKLAMDIHADIDLATGRITWVLEASDSETGWSPTDPYAGFLAPTDSEAGDRRGDGFVAFTVTPLAGLQTGDTIVAQADIVFDANPVVSTPPYLNTIDAETPMSSVAPLPAEVAGPDIVLFWTAEDPPGGSGLAGTTIYARQDGGTFQAAIFGGQDEATGTFSGARAGARYEFYSVASDLAGNVEGAPTDANGALAPDATTVVAVQVPSGPVIASRTSNTLLIRSLDSANADHIEHAVYEQISGRYVGADGRLVDAAFWQPAAQWSNWQVRALSAATEYHFAAQARSSSGAETAFGAPVSATTTRAGDVDSDDVVNQADITLVQKALNRRYGQAGFDARADLNGDGLITYVDLGLVRRAAAGQ